MLIYNAILELCFCKWHGVIRVSLVLCICVYIAFLETVSRRGIGLSDRVSVKYMHI